MLEAFRRLLVASSLVSFVASAPTLLPATLQPAARNVSAAKAGQASCTGTPAAHSTWQEPEAVEALKSLKVVQERAPRPRSKHGEQRIAVTLRGDMRGDAQDGVDCASSVVRSFIDPCAQQHPPCSVDVFGVVYADAASGGSGSAGGWESVAQQTLMNGIAAQYGPHLASLATIKRHEQQTAVVSAVHAVLDYQARHRLKPQYYDAVVVTRWDIHFKTNFPALLLARSFLGPHLQPGVGILWHESASIVDGHTCPGNACPATANELFPKTDAELERFERVPDCVFTVSGRHAQCFISMVQTLTPNALGHDILRTSGQRDFARYLLPHDVFDSNPLRCQLNPIYDMLPRNRKMVDEKLCQAESDYIVDAESGTTCCPAPGYCCPHTAIGCSAEGATKYSGALTDCQ